MRRRSHRAPLPPPVPTALADALDVHVTALATDIGERNGANPRRLARAADYIEAALVTAGYRPRRLPLDRTDVPTANIEAIHRNGAKGSRVVVIGAHYDTAPGTPGADDNATGVAALIEIAAALAPRALASEVRFVAFANEEPPHFGTDEMGSRSYARALAAANTEVAAMLSLESLGYYDDTPGSQRYPAPLGWWYPDRGDFVGFVGNFASAALVRRAVQAFRDTEPFPSQGTALPEWVPGVGWSDHQAFWRHGWPALMVTDTAPFRSPWYHGAADTADKIDRDRLARVTRGLIEVVVRLAAAD